jgi:hypothetical protein
LRGKKRESEVNTGDQPDCVTTTPRHMYLQSNSLQKRGTQEGLGDSDQDQEGVTVIGWTTRGNNIRAKGKNIGTEGKGYRNTEQWRCRGEA